MSKEIKKAQSTEVQGFDDSEFSVMSTDNNITARDIIIPKVLVMQGQSPRVLEGENKFGDLVETLNWNVVAKAKSTNNEAQSMEFVPFAWSKKWIVRKLENGQWKFDHVVDMTRENENLDQYEEWNVGTMSYKREYAHFFQVISPISPLPMTLCFRGASKKSGDALVTQMYISNAMLKTADAYKKSPVGAFMSLTPVKETNKDGKTFIKLEIKRLRETTKEEALEALNWFKTIKSGETKVDYNVDEPQAAPMQGVKDDDIAF